MEGNEETRLKERTPSRENALQGPTPLWPFTGSKASLRYFI